MDFRSNVKTSLEQLASDAAEQRNLKFPPEELRLQWEGSFFVLEVQSANPDALSNFSDVELVEIRRFDEFIWSLPPEPNAMWHRDNLDAAPWPEVRARAKELLDMLRTTPPMPQAVLRSNSTLRQAHLNRVIWGVYRPAPSHPQPADRLRGYAEGLDRLGMVAFRRSVSGGGPGIVAIAPNRYRSGMIWNIIDRRSRRYRWKRINAIIEATEHDNSVFDSDEAPDADAYALVVYDQRESISVEEAVNWANERKCPVTLYLYDEGAGTRQATIGGLQPDGF